MVEEGGGKEGTGEEQAVVGRGERTNAEKRKDRGNKKEGGRVG